jgi:hypothetical protein
MGCLFSSLSYENMPITDDRNGSVFRGESIMHGFNGNELQSYMKSFGFTPFTFEQYVTYTQGSHDNSYQYTLLLCTTFNHDANGTIIGVAGYIGDSSKCYVITTTDDPLAKYTLVNFYDNSWNVKEFNNRRRAVIAELHQYSAKQLDDNHYMKEWVLLRGRRPLLA